jgi:hypothetical protein
MMNAVLKPEASDRGSHISVPVTCVFRVLRWTLCAGRSQCRGLYQRAHMFVLSPVPS